jgi:hypothetical protein
MKDILIRPLGDIVVNCSPREIVNRQTSEITPYLASERREVRLTGYARAGFVTHPDDHG